VTGGPILAIDTSTTIAVVALGDPNGSPIAADAWTTGHRHGEELLPRIGRVLAGARVELRELGAIVVGTGPGAFTGLRVGVATAKALAHALDLPIVGVSSGEALLAAAAVAGAPNARLVLLLPAGPSDRVVVRRGARPELLPGGVEPAVDPEETVVAVDLADRAAADAVDRGEEARAGLAAALLEIGAARLRSGDADDLARLVPEYVTLPRGVRASSGEVAWSRDLP
jgi:tRNA threonylcarbamoyl adenosine modification protein YeaZ